MKKSVVIAISVVFLLIIVIGVVGVGSKKVDCSGIEDAKQKNRCHLYNLLNSYGFVNDYDEFMKKKPYERPAPKYFTQQFRDESIDSDNDGKFEAVRIYAGVNVEDAGEYGIQARVYDDKNVHIYYFEGKQQLNKGLNELVVEVTSQKIYEHKVFGYLKLMPIILFKDGKQLEVISPEWQSTPYGYDDFSAILPDLIIKSTEKKGNDVIVTIENAGKKPAFTVFVDFLVDGKLHFDKTNQNSVVLLKPGEQKQFTMTAPNANEYSVIVDPWNKVDESDETNNELLIIK